MQACVWGSVGVDYRDHLLVVLRDVSKYVALYPEKQGERERESFETCSSFFFVLLRSVLWGGAGGCFDGDGVVFDPWGFAASVKAMI